MTQLETRLKKLEELTIAPEIDLNVIFLSMVPAVDGAICPEYAARGPQRAYCDGREYLREPGETQVAFEARVTKSIEQRGRVVVATLK